jgi:uncharacterized protein Yka (UPF0111/DUF47 family)
MKVIILTGPVAKLLSPTIIRSEVIKWKEIYETMENAIDRCERGQRARGIALKNARS